MDRLACVELPALPLQLLLRRQPDWRAWPCAVVDRDSPQGRILWVNERARAVRILPGQRYAAALSLSSTLRADVVEPREIEEGIAHLTALLLGFTPGVEPSDDEPGVFWLDASGLGRLFRSATRWARSIRTALDEESFEGAVVVGFTRFGTYAAARGYRGAGLVTGGRRQASPASGCPDATNRVTGNRHEAGSPSRRDAAGTSGAPDLRGRREESSGGRHQTGPASGGRDAADRVTGVRDETRSPSRRGAAGLRGVRVFRTAGEEEDAARAVPIERLGFEPALRDALDKLGVTRLGQFLELPAHGLLQRFGEDAWRLHRMASGRLWTPLDPVEDRQPLTAELELEQPDSDAERLLFAVKMMLDPLLDDLAGRHAALRGVHLDLRLDDGATKEETIRPAEPTRDAVQILDLVRLRLESLQLTSGVVEIDLEVEEDLAPSEQFRLWSENPRRDLKAADRALARLRAELGGHAVVRAALTDGHMPEACFRWEPLERLSAQPPGHAARSVAAAGGENAARSDRATRSEGGAHDASASSPAGRASGWVGARRGRKESAVDDGPRERRPSGRPLIRRMLERPLPLPPRQHHLRDDGWLIRGSDYGAVSRFVGPFVVSGGWWMRAVHRDYHFAETQRGDLLWVYFDRQRRRWFMQGGVE